MRIAQLKAMVEAVGLRWLTAFGGWKGEPLTPQARRIVALAEK